MENQLLQAQFQTSGRRKIGAADSAREFFLGAVFAARNWRGLLTLTLPVLVAEIFAARTLWLNALPREEHMLLGVALAIVNGWLLAGAGMLVLERVQGRRGQFLQLSARALQFLPKIFFSYLGLIALIGTAMLLPPAAIFLPLFLWAPMYCIAETFAPVPEAPPLPEDEDDEEGFAELERVIQVWRHSQFTGKRIWDLGYFRSTRFAFRHPGLSLVLAAAFLFAGLGPAALATALFGPESGLRLPLAQVVFSALFDVGVIAIWAAAFVFALRPQDLREIQINVDGVSAFIFPRPGWIERLRPQVAVGLVFVLLGSAILSWWKLSQHAVQQRMLPEGVKSELLELKSAERGLVVEFGLTDQAHQLRWFEPTLLRVDYLFARPKDAAATSIASKAIDRKTERPERLRLLAQDGAELDPGFFRPRPAVRVRLVAPLPQGAPVSEIELIYQSPNKSDRSRVLLRAPVSAAVAGGHRGR